MFVYYIGSDPIIVNLKIESATLNGYERKNKSKGFFFIFIKTQIAIYLNLIKHKIIRMRFL